MELESNSTGTTREIILLDGSVEVGRVASNLEESFTLDTFAELIAAKHEQENPFIIACVKTRDKFDIRQTSLSFYDALSLNRILFKQHHSTGELIHRYHRGQPFTVLNPLTNSPIIGEVQYYAVTPQNDESKENHTESAESLDHNYTAHFIGTDYNYAFSSDLQKVFADNDTQNSRLETDNSNSRFVDMLGDVGQFNFQPHNIADNQALLPTTIDVSYPRSVMFGFLVAFYGLVSFLIFSVALVDLLAIYENSGDDSSRKEVWYWSFLPFFSFTIDRFVATMHRESEQKRWMMVKFALWTAYLLFPTIIFQRGTTQYILSRDVMDVIFPVLFVGYSCTFYVKLNRRRRLV